jgi:glycosyltransferase involved in cell wall biosynthesis
MKTVSIIIPARNEEKHLPGCLGSIARLKYPKELVETIVVDNGSTDRTREAAAEFGAAVFRDDGKNVSGLRNLGAERATGEILAFVDADCEVAEDWLERAAVYFDDRATAAWGAPPEPPEDGTWVQKSWYLVRRKAREVQEVDWLETMNLFVRRDDFSAVSGFNEELVTCEDVDFSYRIRRRGAILSDSRIRVVHLGEAATLSRFVQKELWRGRSNWQGVRSHGWSLRELPSLLLPVYFGVALPAALAGALLVREPAWLLGTFALLVAPSGGAAFKVLQKKKVGLTDLLKLCVLLQAYFFSRTLAAFRRS